MSTSLGALERVACEHGAAVAWSEDGRETSFTELLDRIARARKALDRAHVGPHDLVAVRGATALDVVVLALGVRAAGAVVRTQLPGSDAPPSPTFEVRTDGADLRVDRQGAAGAPVPLPSEIAWIRITSGSSGAARAVAFTEAQAVAAARRAGALLGDDPGPALVTTISPASGYGWNSGAMGPLLRGMTVVAVPPTSPRGFLDAIDRAHARVAVTTPTVVRALARLPGTGGPRSVRVVVAGDAYPEEAALEVGRRHGLDVLDRYGSTETGAVAQARVPGGPLEVAPGVEVGDDGSPPTLWVRSDAVAEGEFRSDGGWRRFGERFPTPDSVTFEDPRSFRVVSRVDRVVKRSGRVVDLAGLERRVLEHPAVALARVVVRHAGIDSRFEAQVVPRAGVTIDSHALLDEFSRRLPEWERLARVDVVPAHEATGKWSGDPADADAIR